MKALFIKPDLSMYFKAMPLIGIWLNADYNEADTIDEMVSLVHKWLTIAETTTNPVKKQWYEIAAHNLYSIITKKTYQSLLPCE